MGWEHFVPTGRGRSESRAIVVLRDEAQGKATRLRLLGSSRDMIVATHVRVEVNRETGQIALYPDDNGRKISNSKGGAYISVTGLTTVFPAGSKWEMWPDGDGWIGHPVPTKGRKP